MTSRTAAILLLLTGASVSAQQVVRQGPPPEIRELIGAVLDAHNSGSADTWETLAKARFTPALLQSQTAAQRAEAYRKFVDAVGTGVSPGAVQREGPDAPLRVRVKGATGTGVIVIGPEAGTPLRIGILNFEADASAPPAVPAGGVPLPPLDPTLTSAEIDKRLDAYFSKLAADDVFSGVALVAKNGVPVFLKAYGMADREKKAANTIRTRFNIGSINKAFTQTAVRQLIRDGKLSLTDTLGKLFPDYPQAASRAATVEQLLGHRAGLSDFFGAEFTRAPKDRFASNADYFKFVSGLPPTFAPGERNQYCNGCYIALGAIVEKVSGMPYEKYVAENVFGRAEMTSTGYPRSDRPASDIALGYTRRGGDGTLQTNIAMHGVTGSAAGGGYSTALDLLTYVKAVRAGRFPGEDANMGIAGGAPGTNAVLEARGEWVVIVLTNFDPPAGERIGVAIANALNR